MTQVSVIVPAYNAVATLDRTLASVRAQSHTALEILVIDDGSTDDTAALAARHASDDPRVRVIQQDNAGVASARNAGISQAVSDWVAPVDADDVWHPQTIERFLQAAENAPAPVTFVYTWSRRIDEQYRVLGDLCRSRYTGDVLAQLIAVNFTRNASASMLDRAKVLQAGGYDTGLQSAGAHGAEDIDLYLRLAAIGPVAMAKGYHVGYRQVSGSMSQNADRMRRSIGMALEKCRQDHPKAKPALFDLAETNYDLYAADLSLSGGNWSGFSGYLRRALKRNPTLTLLKLSVFGTARVLSKLIPATTPTFNALEPDEAHSWPLIDLVTSAQNRIYRGLMRHPWGAAP